ncbi:sulfurtransferase TusA family protein [Rhodobacter lacus]|uniref:Sulfurtransferase TusA family protein n=1 Tax=Rhodobacter lacus TaxID=1641972 RepID=A0ABW5A6L2_9RHOB
MADQIVDAKGLNCPLPILRTKKAIKEMSAGQVLEIQATDPGSVADFEAFCRTTGNEMLAHRVENGTYVFEIKIA